MVVHQPPSRPIDASTLHRLNRRLGLPPARAARNTALLTLARDVPPIVLADLLGMSAGTAEQWHQLAGGRWTSFVLDDH